MDNVVLYGNTGWYNNSASTTTTLLTTNNTTYLAYDPPNAVRVREPEAVARQEDPFAWLRRRVAEVSWTPEIA